MKGNCCPSKGEREKGGKWGVGQIEFFAWESCELHSLFSFSFICFVQEEFLLNIYNLQSRLRWIRLSNYSLIS